jgi:hypothetical protein
MTDQPERSDQPERPVPAARADGQGGPSVRGQLVLAVVGVTAGSVLTLWAMTRRWAVEVLSRPAPLHDVSTVHTGADLVPWVPALALVALAGAGALVATRSAGRVLVSALLVVLGAGSALGAGYGLLDAKHQWADASPAWPLVALAGGVVVAAVGLYALRRCRSWPTMGTRYEAPTRHPAADAASSGGAGSGAAANDGAASGGAGASGTASDPSASGGAGSDAAGAGGERPVAPGALTGRRRVVAEDDPATLWDALDEGHDPTDR